VVAVAVYLVSFYIFVSIFSDGAESAARWKILAIALLATLLLNGISSESPTLLGLGIACLAAAIVSLAGLIFWVKVTRLQALKITGSYIGFVLAYSVVIGLIFQAFGVHAA
jgi:Kef-type K+ transport system membrane component KefB